MQTDPNNKSYYPVAEEEINLRKVFVLVLKNWYLFVLFGILGAAGGYLHNRYSNPTYQVQATIYVPAQKSSMGARLEDMFSSQLTGNKSEVFNQIEIIKSFSLNDQVARNLNWRTQWFKKDALSLDNLLHEKDLFEWKAYYKDEPFHVKETPGAFNSPGIELYLQPISANQFQLNVDGESIYNGVEKEIDLEIVGTYGEPISNENFNFTITPNGKSNEDLDNIYCFIFNEPASIASQQLKKLHVNLNDKESEIIKLQIEGKSPQHLIDYLNELINVYMQDKMSFQTETQKRSLFFIDSQLGGISDSLNSAGSSFTEFKAKNKIINIGEQGTQVMETLMNIESDRNKNQMQLAYFRNLLEYLGKSDDIKQLIAPSVVGIEDLALNTMVLKLSELYARRQVLSFSANETNPTLLMIDKEISQANARLKENLRNLVHNAEVINRSLDSQKETINAQLNKLPAKEQDLINFQRRYDLTNEIYTFLLQKRSEINIALAGATPEVQVIDAARPETTSLVGLSSMSKVMIGLMLGMFFPALFILTRSLFSGAIESQEDIEGNTNLPLLGNVIHSRTNSDTPVNDNPCSGIAESYRSIRTNLQFMLADVNRKVVSINSTNPGEGKSFSSVNLATILAMNDKKVVLIGADMRKARLHKIFGLANTSGLSTYLSGQDELKNILFESRIDNLMVIPAGPVPPNPSELIDRPQMQKLIEELSDRYDYIIIDNAPVSLVTDGLLMGRHAHLNIFILRYGVSKKEQIKYINQIAENKIMNNVTLVVNDVKGSSFASSGNYYYGNKYSENGNGYFEGNEKVHPIWKFFSRN